MNNGYIASEEFGRVFWIDEKNDFRSAPLLVKGGADLTQCEYVEEWTDLEGLKLGELLDIQKQLLNSNIRINHSLKL